MSAVVSALSPVEWISLGVLIATLIGFAHSSARARRFRRLYLFALGAATAALGGALVWFYRPGSWLPILRDAFAGEGRGALALLAALVAGPLLGRRIRRLYGAATVSAGAAFVLIALLAPNDARTAAQTSYAPIGATDADSAAQRKAALRALAQSNQIVFARRDAALVPLCRCGPKLEADEVPSLLADVLIATEDRRFRDHYGVDPIGVLRAGFRLVTARSIEGGSSLTQQLVKNALLSPARTLARKSEEASLAQELETAMTKSEIVAAYLNQASFGADHGREIVGAKQAALVFFGRDLDELTLGEFAGLVAILRGPTLYSPTRNPASFEKRRRLVLDHVAQAGLAADRAIAAARAPIRARGKRQPHWPETRWAIEAAMAGLARQAPGFAPAPGARVALTFVFDRQVALQRAVAGARIDPELEVAAVALGLDGRLLAAQGGRDYGATQFNRAVTMRRPAASTAKIFVYAAALAAGRAGDETSRRRFAESDNDYAVELARALGVDRIEEMARALGLSKPFTIRDPSNVALGANDVGLLELAGAMLPFASQDAPASPWSALALRGADGALWRRQPGASSPLARSVAPAMRALLRSVTTSGTARGAIRRLDVAAGKTGTGEDNRDGWFVGYTPRHVVGVWLGRDDNAPHPGLTGARAAAVFDAIGAAMLEQTGALARSRPPAGGVTIARKSSARPVSGPAATQRGDAVAARR